ncbi:antibiotic biosynthesis monooxygenase family protein [Amycolatopsis sp. NPDC049868]|uniref:antibiotic biosynthesis monooxygenase family protein n=1 Tax=Amycolatopsis sp. NPDC049868 TaxID=3363934 RepID=UPI0037B96DD5
MNAGFRAVIELRMDPPDVERFLVLWPEMAAEVATATGVLDQWLFASDGAGLTIMSDWVDEAAFRAFEASAVHAAHRARIGPIRTGGDFRGLSVAGHHPREDRR